MTKTRSRRRSVRIKTDREIVDGANELAHRLYRLTGFMAPEGFEFWTAKRQRELVAWEMAVVAYDHIEQTCVNSALSNLELA